MHLLTFVKAGTFALDAVSESFSPRTGSTSKEVRINGAICVGVGILCFACFIPIALFVGADKTAKLFLLPSLLGYAFSLVGGYRLVFGATPKADPHEVMSYKRILFGVAWVLLLFGLPIGLAFLFKS